VATTVHFKTRRNGNPGFLRRDTILAIVFVTKRIDCSARNPQLFDPHDPSLGPLGFRCFEKGVRCDVNDRDVPGERHLCKPAFDWLYKVKEYVHFFESLKQEPPEDRMILAAIAGPPSPVVVGHTKGTPTLEPRSRVESARAETSSSVPPRGAK